MIFPRSIFDRTRPTASCRSFSCKSRCVWLVARTRKQKGLLAWVSAISRDIPTLANDAHSLARLNFQGRVMSVTKLVTQVLSWMVTTVTFPDHENLDVRLRANEDRQVHLFISSSLVLSWTARTTKKGLANVFLPSNLFESMEARRATEVFVCCPHHVTVLHARFSRGSR